MVHSHTVHLPLSALPSPCTTCDTGAQVLPAPRRAAHSARARDAPAPTVLGGGLQLRARPLGGGRAVRPVPPFRLRRRGADPAHGALPHRAPSPRRTAADMGHVWHTGEEMSIGVRSWTHGYDLYAPARSVVYHEYTAAPHTVCTATPCTFHSVRAPCVQLLSPCTTCASGTPSSRSVARSETPPCPTGSPPSLESCRTRIDAVHASSHPWCTATPCRCTFLSAHF